MACREGFLGRRPRPREHFLCSDVQGPASLRNWNWTKKAEDIEAVGDVGVALLTRHGHPSH